MTLPRALLLLVTASAACQSDEFAFETADQWLQVMEKVQCERAARCGGIGHAELFECKALASAHSSIYPLPYSLDEAVKAGRLLVDMRAAAACMGAALAVGCTDEQFESLLQQQCDLVALYRGLVTKGGICRSSRECITGFCGSAGMPVVSGCAGTCQSYIVLDSACDPTAAGTCTSADYCPDDTRVCTRRQGSGQRCVGLDGCLPGFLCKGYEPAHEGQPASPGTCAPPGKVGEPCTLLANDLYDCDPGLYCDFRQSPSRCAPRHPQGEPCYTRFQCQDGLACAGVKRLDMKTVAPGVCTPFLDLYLECSGADLSFSIGGGVTGAYSSACPYDMYCSTTGMTCDPRGQPGGYCTIDKNTHQTVSFFGCRPGYYCDSAREKCIPQLPLGASCDQTASPDNVCADSVCSPGSGLCERICGPA